MPTLDSKTLEAIVNEAIAKVVTELALVPQPEAVSCGVKTKAGKPCKNEAGKCRHHGTTDEVDDPYVDGDTVTIGFTNGGKSNLAQRSKKTMRALGIAVPKRISTASVRKAIEAEGYEVVIIPAADL